MESFNKEDRLFAVKITEELFIDKIDFDNYLMQFPDDDRDEVLIELYNLIEQPYCTALLDSLIVQPN